MLLLTKAIVMLLKTNVFLKNERFIFYNKYKRQRKTIY